MSKDRNIFMAGIMGLSLLGLLPHSSEPKATEMPKVTETAKAWVLNDKLTLPTGTYEGIPMDLDLTAAAGMSTRIVIIKEPITVYISTPTLYGTVDDSR